MIKGEGGAAKKILIAEDCPIQKNLYEKVLNEFCLVFSSSEAESLKYIEQQPFDMLIIDVELDPGNGIDLCRTVKSNSLTDSIPTLMVSSKTEIGDLLLGFDGGADDYIKKPFHPLELKARMKALLKRAERQNHSRFEWEVGPLKLNPKTLTLAIQKDKVTEIKVMTAAEYRLLSYFMKNQDVILSRDQILEGAWGHSIFVTDRTVDAKISNLRKKIEPYGKYLQSIYGLGYKFSTQREDTL